ncbi:MAG: DUF6159 family protein [Massilia sp.]
MFTRLSRSFDLIKASATVLRAQRQLLLFPLIAGAAMTFIVVSFLIPLFASGSFDHAERGGFSPMTYSLTFLLYVINYFIMFYFNTALVACVMQHFDGGTPTLSDGMRAANARFGAILGYAVISATIGMVLRAIQERVPFAGKVIVALIGAGWAVASFLVVPVLVVQNTGPIESVRESASLMRCTWGENVAGQAGMGFAFGLIQLAVVTVAALLTAVVVTMHLAVLVIPILVLTVVAVLGVMLTHTALTGIYSATLYRYAETGKVEGFDDGVLSTAFLPK